ncbi:MAG TPA: HdeD family acid-resistance protein [Casimicrobiaceae bacterium]|nr:HdeD family acid-resistance protein [Casimicrobiaceae bacterium]
MKELLGQAWWMLALRGVVALLFGVFALIWPGLALLWIVAMFAAYALIGGIGAVAASVRNRTRDRGWWIILLVGVVSIGAAIVAVLHPEFTVFALVLLMGVNAIITGVLDIAIAVRLRKAIHGEWLLALVGVISIVFGIAVFVFPAAGALAMVWLMSAYALLVGIMFVALAIRARGWKRSTQAGDLPPGRVQSATH